MQLLPGHRDGAKDSRSQRKGDFVSARTESFRVLIFPREALNALIGKPAACVWETSVVGYDVTLWHYDAVTQTDNPTRTQFCATRPEADALKRRWLGRN